MANQGKNKQLFVQRHAEISNMRSDLIDRYFNLCDALIMTRAALLEMLNDSEAGEDLQFYAKTTLDAIKNSMWEQLPEFMILDQLMEFDPTKSGVMDRVIDEFMIYFLQEYDKNKSPDDEDKKLLRILPALRSQMEYDAVILDFGELIEYIHNKSPKYSRAIVGAWQAMGNPLKNEVSPDFRRVIKRAAGRPDRNPVKGHLIPHAQLWRDMRRHGSLAPKDETDHFTVDLGPKRDKSKFTAMALFTLENDKNIKVTDRFTNYEMIVLSYVFSELHAGNMEFTDEDIAHGIYGQPATASVAPTTISDIKAAMNKFSYTRAQLDFSDEMRMKKYRDQNGEQIKTLEFDSAILAFTRVSYTTHKKGSGEYYKLLEIPPLYTYLKVTRKMSTIPRELIEIIDGQGVRIPMKRNHGLVLLYAIFERISIMNHEVKKAMDTYRKQYTKNGQLRKNIKRERTPLEIWESTRKVHAPYRILFDSLASAAGIDIPANGPKRRDKLREVRNTVYMILDSLQLKDWILGYRTVKQGRAIVGVDIIFPSVNNELQVNQQAH